MTVEVETPEGVLYYTICDDTEGRPIKVITSIGKAGSALAAWSFALDQVINLALENGVGINELIEKLGGTSNDRRPHIRQGVTVRSGPEGIVTALLEYKRNKFLALRNILGGISDVDDDSRPHMLDG